MCAAIFICRYMLDKSVNRYVLALSLLSIASSTLILMPTIIFVGFIFASVSTCEVRVESDVRGACRERRAR
jgi:hypothetical protein